MLDVNERVNSLSGYDMRDVTTADSNETTLNGTLQLHAYGELRRTDPPTGGRVQRLQRITRRCPTA
jgi:hypothetical protein